MDVLRRLDYMARNDTAPMMRERDGRKSFISLTRAMQTARIYHLVQKNVLSKNDIADVIIWCVNNKVPGVTPQRVFESH